MTNNLFIILDGNAIMHRSFHAIRPLNTREGELVNAVFGFASILMTILTQEQPRYIACTFDTKAPTFRHEKYEDYKATRVKAPDEFYAQIPRIHQMVDTLNIPKLTKDGFEADDLIGTVVKTNEKEHPELRNKIVTSDMDAMQLVTDKTCVSSLHKGYQSTECFYPAEVEKKYGLRPDQIVDFKALQGDSSDNIPGVKGIGKVGALQLLQEFGSLDGIYRHLDQVKGKKHDLLTEQKEQAYFSQELATIKTDVPLDYTLEACTAHDFNQNAATALFESLQFYSIIRRMQQWKKGGNMKKGSGLKKEEVAKIFGNREVQSQLF